jgi:hypothetical protein
MQLKYHTCVKVAMDASGSVMISAPSLACHADIDAHGKGFGGCEAEH